MYTAVLRVRYQCPCMVCVSHKDAVNSVSMLAVTTFLPCKTMFCEQQLMLKITVTHTGNLAIGRLCKYYFNPVNNDEIPGSHFVLVQSLLV